MSDGNGDVIAQDPFWSTFRSRHPDVDIVLQHEAPPSMQQSSVPPGGDPEAFLGSQLAAVEALWERLVGRSRARCDTQWIPGEARDSLRCSLTLTLDDVVENDGLGRLRGALQLLPAEGWDVFAPPTGMPRINADRRRAEGVEEVLFGYTPEMKRLFLRLRSTGLPVKEEQAQALMGTSA